MYERSLSALVPGLLEACLDKDGAQTCVVLLYNVLSHLKIPSKRGYLLYFHTRAWGSLCAK